MLNKFNACRTARGFPSKLEAAVFYLLDVRQRAGEISDIKRQQVVVLQDGDRSTRITWRVDFSYVDAKTGETVFVEAKGMETGEYKLKLKMWRANPPAKLEIWKGNYNKPILVETIDAFQRQSTKGIK